MEVCDALDVIRSEWKADMRTLKSEWTADMRAQNVENRHQIRRFKDDLITQMGLVKADLTGEIALLKSDVKTRMHAEFGSVKVEIGGVKADVIRIEGQGKNGRREVRQKTDKLANKIDTLTRSIGSSHERHCRDALNRNIPYLVGRCPRLISFWNPESRTKHVINTVQDLRRLLRFQGSECAKLRTTLVHAIRQDPMKTGCSILRQYVALVLRVLQRDYGKWINMENSCLRITNMLRFTDVAITFSDVKIELQILRNLSRTTNIPVLDADFLEPIIDLFVITAGSDFEAMNMVMEKKWGLLFLLWSMRKENKLLRHAIIELDARGLVEREAMLWHLAFGEVKSSVGKAIEKGKRQLNLIEEVAQHAITTIGGSVADVLKCIFVVQPEQENTVPICEEGDFILVDITHLP